MRHVPFAATNQPDTCLWCGAKLCYVNDRGKHGPNDHGHFCRAECAQRFAVNMADLGHRLRPIPQE